MEKEEKRQVLDILAQNASDDYLAGYLNGYNAAQTKSSQNSKGTTTLIASCGTHFDKIANIKCVP